MHSMDTTLEVGILSMLDISMDSVSRMGNLHAHISGRLPVVCSMEPLVTVYLASAVLVMRGTLMVLLHLWEMTTFVIVWLHLLIGLQTRLNSIPTMRCGMVSRASTHVTITIILRGLRKLYQLQLLMTLSYECASIFPTMDPRDFCSSWKYTSVEVIVNEYLLRT